MSFEIELKARLDDFEAVKKRLPALGKYCRSYKKSDSYWQARAEAAGSSIPPYGIRVRRESGIEADAGGRTHEAVLVTYKTKEISGGIEVNDEAEFAVSDAAVFEALLGRLGLYRDICKEKEGWAWTVPSAGGGGPPILAELSRVAGLGWFLELETLAADNSPHTVAESRARLFALLEKLEIPADRIEARPYAEMLKGVGSVI